MLKLFLQDDKVAYNRVLCIIILSIWSWSLLQFTLALTSNPNKVPKKTKVRVKDQKHNCCVDCCHTTGKVCCSVDVWSILINIILQDAPYVMIFTYLMSYDSIILNYLIHKSILGFSRFAYYWSFTTKLLATWTYSLLAR